MCKYTGRLNIINFYTLSLIITANIVKSGKRILLNINLSGELIEKAHVLTLKGHGMHIAALPT